MQVQLKRKSPKKQQFVANLVVRQQAGHKTRGVLAAGQHRFQCALGRSGISSRKHEGDGATPLASMRLLGGFKRCTYPAFFQSLLKMHYIRPHDGWCDASGDANYNRSVRLPYRASAEKMQRQDHLYDIGLILDWNISCRKMGKGSAIFMHLARDGYLPTEGCIALKRRDMARLLPFLSSKTKITVLR